MAIRLHFVAVFKAHRQRGEMGMPHTVRLGRMLDYH